MVPVVRWSLFFLSILVPLVECGTGGGHRGTRKLVVVMVDGLGKWMLDDPRLSAEDLKGFRSLGTHGVRATMTPEFPTLTLPNHQTMLTGLHVENHGIIADYMFDVINKRYFRRFTQPGDFEISWWNESEPIWLTAQKQDVKTSVHWFPSCKFSDTPVACDVVNDAKFPVNSNSLKRKFNEIVEKLKHNDVNFVLLHYDRIENVSRAKGSQSGETLNEIRQFSDSLEQLQKGLTESGLWSSTNVVVLSDHGLIDVPLESNWFFIDDFVDMKSIEAVVNTGAFMMVYPYKGSEFQVYKDLSTMTFAKVYWNHELPTKWYLKNAKHLSPIIIVAEVPNGIYCRTREKLVPNAPKGATLNDMVPKCLSGFDNKDEKMSSILYARGPDFRQNYTVLTLRLVDVYQIMCHVFDIECNGHNGSWHYVVQMLTKSLSKISAAATSDNDKQHIMISSYDSLSSKSPQSGYYCANPNVLLSRFLFIAFLLIVFTPIVI